MNDFAVLLNDFIGGLIPMLWQQ